MRAVMVLSRLAALGLAGVLGLGAASAAKKQRIVGCVLDAPGSARAAKPYFDQFYRAVEKAMGWAEGTLSGYYTPRKKRCHKELRKKKTTVAILSAETFVALRNRLGLRAVAVAEVAGASSTRLHVVVKKGKAADLAALKGATFHTNHGADARFLARVVLGGALGKKVDVKRTREPLRALRAVHKGDSDATILDDAELEKMKALSFADELAVVHTSPAIPHPIVAVIGARGGDAVDGLGQKLVALCGGEGKAICEGLRLSGFGTLDSASIDALSDAYGK